MALSPKPRMTEKNLAAEPRRGSLSQSVGRRTTSRVQGTVVWASRPERARSGFRSRVQSRLTSPKAERRSALQKIKGHGREEEIWKVPPRTCEVYEKPAA